MVPFLGKGGFLSAGEAFLRHSCQETEIGVILPSKVATEISDSTIGCVAVSFFFGLVWKNERIR
ncbi:hypothetical protein ASF27_11755 [Methylobacterium sp. Leaf102]|nr:hypothetical protein ASF27_11755 [Methylobacterium sp. Leaf102]